MLEVQDIAESLHLRRMVIEHQQRPGEGEHDEQIESDASHSPCVAVTNRIAVDLCGMQVQEHVGKHAQGAITWRVVMLVAEYRSVDLGLCRRLSALNMFLDI